MNIDKNTNKAFLLYNGYFLFMFGYGNNKNDNKLDVVRFGGHRENNETISECLIREIKEETSLDIDFYDSEITYVIKNDYNEYKTVKLKESFNPILIKENMDNWLSLMYLTYGKGELKPNMETQGILLLRKEDIELICTKDITFKQYKESGGKYILAKILCEDAFLVPGIQLQFLHNLFSLQEELILKYVNNK